MTRMRGSLLFAALSISGAVTLVACKDAASDGAGDTSDLTVSDDLVIRQIYGGGGNTAAPYKNDFIELFNRGAAAVSLANKSLQYAKADGPFSATSSVLALPADVMLQPGQSYLIKMKSGGDVGVELASAPDFSPETPLSLGNANGKVAIVKSDALLDACGTTAAPCADDKYIDLVGYGSSQQAEGTAVSAMSNTTAALRKNAGCADTGNNALDFEVVAPSFRNALSAATPCAAAVDGGPAPDASPTPEAGSDTGVAAVDAGPAPDAGSGGTPDAAATDAGPKPDAGSVTVSTVLLNEIKINPPGNTDTPWEYAEIACPANSSLAGYYFVAFEGDGDSSTGSPGVADIVVDLGTQNCGSNGLAVIKATTGGHPVAAPTAVFTTASLDTGSGFENASTSFAIVKSPTAPMVQGTDYDMANGGTLALPAGASIVDGVALFEQTNGVVDYTYVPRLAKTGVTADAASRVPGATTPLSEAAWYFGDLDGTNGDSVKYNPAKASANLPANAVLTPGAPNMAAVAPPPGPGTGQGEDDPAQPGTGEEDPGGDDTSSPTGTGGSGDSRTRPSATAPAPKTPSTASCAVGPGSSSSTAGLLGLVVALAAAVTRRKRSR